jgi:hypothetical protein
MRQSTNTMLLAAPSRGEQGTDSGPLVMDALPF